MVQKRQQNHRTGSLKPHQKYLVNEAKSLLVRLKQVQPFVFNMPTVDAAKIPDEAQKSITELLVKSKKELRKKVQLFMTKIATSPRISPADSRKAFALLKLKFNALLDSLDIFSDVLTQRGEHETGIWLAGLDTVAKDALSVIKKTQELPPLITYLDRGHGAAIRRARTRLPGGNKNPVAVIRVPRERMISSSIASSLIHEVGHQGAALLGLIPSIRSTIRKLTPQQPNNANVWQLFDRWISEILSDLWSVGMVGVSATTGLMGVVTLPKYFVFRMNLDDPHPFPWIRVKVSSAFGKALYPDAQWQKIDRLWEKLYPMKSVSANQQQLIRQLEKVIPAFVKLVLEHRPKSLRGQRLRSIFPTQHRQPRQLRALFQQWEAQPQLMFNVKPSKVFAVIGQARADQQISSPKEAEILQKMLRRWALKRIL